MTERGQMLDDSSDTRCVDLMHLKTHPHARMPTKRKSPLPPFPISFPTGYRYIGISATVAYEFILMILAMSVAEVSAAEATATWLALHCARY